MRTSKKVLLALLPLVLLAPSLAFAATNQTSLPASLVGGSLSIVAPTLASAFPGIILNGLVQTVEASLSPWSVTDATGTGDGWTVTLSGTQFSEVSPSTGFASGTSALTLPDGSLNLSSGGTVSSQSGATPVSSTGGPYFENVPSTVDGSSFVLIDATSGYGMGSYSVASPSNSLSLTVDPSSTRVDHVNYPSSPTPFSSTLTFSLVSNPTLLPVTFGSPFTNVNGQGSSSFEPYTYGSVASANTNVDVPLSTTLPSNSTIQVTENASSSSGSYTIYALSTIPGNGPNTSMGNGTNSFSLTSTNPISYLQFDPSSPTQTITVSSISASVVSGP